MGDIEQPAEQKHSGFDGAIYIAIGIAAIWTSGYVATSTAHAMLGLGDIPAPKERVLAIGAFFLALAVIGFRFGRHAKRDTSRWIPLAVVLIVCSLLLMAGVTSWGAYASAAIVFGTVQLGAQYVGRQIADARRRYDEGDLLVLGSLFVILLAAGSAFCGPVSYYLPVPLGVPRHLVEVDLKEPDENIEGILVTENDAVMVLARGRDFYDPPPFGFGKAPHQSRLVRLPKDRILSVDPIE